MSWFAIASFIGWALVAATAARVRGRMFAGFTSVVLGLFTLISVTQHARLGFAGSLREYLQLTAYVHFIALIWARMRPAPYRWLVSIPASWHISGTLLAWPWALAALTPWDLPWPWLPHAIAGLGILQSLFTRETEVHVELANSMSGDSSPIARALLSSASKVKAQRALSIVQITDPHLGPFMSVARLREICQRAVERNPDLIMLTGDFLTMEAHGSPDSLAEALTPLQAYRGRVYACLGNHDYEAMHVVESGLAANGVRLLVDESTLVETAVGTVELVGFAFSWRKRREHLTRVCAALRPRDQSVMRIGLLHDPGAFTKLPEGEIDLVLSGHTHGGQIGLVSFGFNWTVVSSMTSIPDHGLWSRGTDRLYVHRGTGHYGFPVRLGVPAEQSMLHVYPAK